MTKLIVGVAAGFIGAATLWFFIQVAFFIYVVLGG
jgi:hypothetical protein